MFIFLILIFIATTAAIGVDFPELPLKAISENSLEYRWANKNVQKSKQLSGMENADGWRHQGFGAMFISNKRSHEGRSSLLLTAPTKGTEPGPEEGRPFGAASAIYTVHGEDWSQWNRISFRVYPDLPGFRVVSLSVIFHNDGAEKVPGPYERNGLNYVLLENQQWNQVYWEIAHLGRDSVTAIELRYRLQGNEPGATDTVRYYFDDLQLQLVEPDHFEGWNVAPGKVAFSHIGYANEFAKLAYASGISATSFSLIELDSKRTVFQKKITTETTPTGTYQKMDFTEFAKPGEYVIKTGDITTRPFQISDFRELYRRTIVKTINHFYCQRCGDEVPGIHSACHRDWLCTHDEKTVVINGGWHDAGDLSQGLVNTSEATYAMFALADHLKTTDPQLSERLLEEGKWGLDWMLKTRFNDGFRCNWATMDFWTDGIIGTVDDMKGRARNDPFANFLAAKAEAKASVMLREHDSIRADYALQCALQDWQFARDNDRYFNITVAAAGLNTSLILFEITADEKYKDAACSYADYILNCQHREELADDVPLSGFFYEDTARQKILHFSHRGHEQEPIVALVQLCTMFPDDRGVTAWRTSLELYTNYYKQISGYTHPYSMMPAGIYDLEQARDETEKEQIMNGNRLNDRYYVRNFPVWKTFRGNCGTVLSQTKGIATTARYLRDQDALNLCYKQLQWVIGLNPFSQSLMYGEGYDFANQYSAMSGDIIGGLPVGVQTHFNRDEPYWPTENCYNWKEIWVHPSSRWLWIMVDFY